jgi:hypothetical protein
MTPEFTTDPKNPIRLTEKEAFNRWFDAYFENYGETGLMDGSTMAYQAWLAAINYERQACAKIAENFTSATNYVRSSEIAQAIRARKE